MKNIDNFIKEMSLIFTNTLTRYDFCQVRFNLDKISINYHNTISLYCLVYKLNKLYQKFKKEYEKLDKLDVAHNIEIIGFNKSNEYKSLAIYLDKPKVCDFDEIVLVLESINNNIKTFITNSSYYHKTHYAEEIFLDVNKVKAYLDLFDKYDDLFRLYKILKNEFLFGDGTYYLFSKINGDFLNNLNSFNLFFGNEGLNYYNNANITLNLGEQLEIDYDKSIISFNGNSNKLIYGIDKILKITNINKNILNKKGARL